MQAEKRKVHTICKEGICPLCGGELEYGEMEILDNGGVNHWFCPQCSATGAEGFDRVFDGNHYDIHDAEGNVVELLPELPITFAYITGHLPKERINNSAYWAYDENTILCRKHRQAHTLVAFFWSLGIEAEAGIWDSEEGVFRIRKRGEHL